MLGPFYSSKVLSPFLVEQVSSLQSKPHPCRVSFLKLGGQVWAFVLSGAHTKDGLYLLWACGHGPIGLANGPIGLARPYLIFYPLQKSRLQGYVSSILSLNYSYNMNDMLVMELA